VKGRAYLAKARTQFAAHLVAAVYDLLRMRG
jgi:hypothetical protein